MADVPALTAVSPVSDDVELEDILRHSEVPTVVIRKDSNSAAAAAAAAASDADDVARLPTPAPMATFEVLSDVEESDMDDVTSLEAQRDATLDSATAASSGSRAKSRDDDTADDDADVQANGTVPAEGMDLLENLNAVDEHNDVELVREDERSQGDEQGQSESTALAAGIPTLVFEDVDADANNETQLSSPECLVNDDNDNDDDDKQQAWQWTADNDQGNFFLAYLY